MKNIDFSSCKLCCQVCGKKFEQEILYDCDKCHALVCEMCSVQTIWKDGSLEILCKTCEEEEEN